MKPTHASPRITFIGFGEAGQSLSAGLLEEGVEYINSYDILFDTASSSQSLLQKAEALGVDISFTLKNAITNADIIISAVTAKAALDVTKKATEFLSPGQYFVDINSVSPNTKKSAFELIEKTGAHYVEAAVMAAVLPYGHKVPILLGGPHANTIEPILDHCGMTVRTVSDKIGRASAIKLSRSIIVKGFEAITMEAFIAAARLNVENEVLNSLIATYPQLDWPTIAGKQLNRSLSHGKRRAEEMRECAEMLRDLEIEPVLTTAIAKRQDWAGSLGLKEYFEGSMPSDLSILLEAIVETQKKND